MKAFSFAACCGFVLAMAATAAQAQNPDTVVPPADTNRTGMVTLAEYQASRETFIMRADSNHDGSISRPEWHTFTKAVRRDLDLGEVKGAERIGQGTWWTALDADGNGVVTPAEINTLTAAKFAEHDLNHDSFISRAEAEQLRRQADAALR